MPIYNFEILKYLLIYQIYFLKLIELVMKISLSI